MAPAAASVATSASRSLCHCFGSRSVLASRNNLRLLQASGNPCCRFWSFSHFTTETLEAGSTKLHFGRILRYEDGVFRGFQRSPFRGRVYVSYHSPDGTPFYYPGEGFAELGIHPQKLLQPGDPDTFQVKIRDVMPVGYFVDMPSGREGYLPANDLGFSGGIERLRTIFQVGQEVTVRITFRGGGGRELLSIRKYDPERPPIEPPKVARSSGSGKHKISSMMRRRAQQQRNNSNA
ncbi:hypothetical protein GOP47_0008495 [Adiantum capillus-veneris]|uniref:S1 motif domain-containing protein n=1 Tax=Adiantum capillus-veneris TaxID=13818 RepID=A0A9D4UZ21_ADICA|nr:hypothetical protein GOP47_0008495 [Adiantum capillus-veneris]